MKKLNKNINTILLNQCLTLKEKIQLLKMFKNLNNIREILARNSADLEDKLARNSADLEEKDDDHFFGLDRFINRNLN